MPLRHTHYCVNLHTNTEIMKQRNDIMYYNEMS
jgi:hypothetical protein